MFPLYISSAAAPHAPPGTNGPASDRSTAATNQLDFAHSRSNSDDAAKRIASTSHRLIPAAHSTTFDSLGAAKSDGV